MILNFLSAYKTQLEEKFGIQKIGLFGSYAKDEAREDSDIDIAIVSVKKDFFIRKELREHLQNSFQTPVDVGYIDSFRYYYRARIEKEMIYV